MALSERVNRSLYLALRATPTRGNNYGIVLTTIRSTIHLVSQHLVFRKEMGVVCDSLPLGLKRLQQYILNAQLRRVLLEWAVSEINLTRELLRDV